MYSTLNQNGEIEENPIACTPTTSYKVDRDCFNHISQFIKVFYRTMVEYSLRVTDNIFKNLYQDI